MRWPCPTPQERLDDQIKKLCDTNDPEAQIESMLSSTSSAMMLSMVCGDRTIDDDLKQRIVKLGTVHSTPEIRDLFENYLPEDQRIKRLGPTVDEKALLAIEGSVERGKHLFDHAKEVNCRACHQIGAVGKKIGPDLSSIGTQRTPAEILASILRPSEKIDAKFRARQILTVDGKVMVGIVVSETDQQVAIVDGNGSTLSLDVEEIEAMQPAAKSAMPDQLLTGMTPQQAADLLASLSAQRK
jgi:putative heme-binding domain-containing protein